MRINKALLTVSLLPSVVSETSKNAYFKTILVKSIVIIKRKGKRVEKKLF